jgi:hypothetical protein
MYDADHPTFNKKGKRSRRAQSDAPIAATVEARGADEIKHTAGVQQAEDTEDNDVVMPESTDDPPSSLVQLPIIRDVPERTVLPDLAHHVDVSAAIPVATVFQPTDDEVSVACGRDEIEDTTTPQGRQPVSHLPVMLQITTTLRKLHHHVSKIMPHTWSPFDITLSTAIVGHDVYPST